MNIIEVASACSLSFQAQESTGSESRRLFVYVSYALLSPDAKFRASIEKFEAAITRFPNSPYAFYQWGKTLHVMAIKFQVQDRIESRKLLELALTKLARAEELSDNFKVRTWCYCKHVLTD